MGNQQFNRNQNQPFQNRGPPQPGPAFGKQPNQANDATPVKPQGPAGQPTTPVQQSPNNNAQNAQNKTPTPQAGNANAAGPPKQSPQVVKKELASPPPVKKDFASPQNNANRQGANNNQGRQGGGMNKPQATPDKAKTNNEEKGDQPQEPFKATLSLLRRPGEKTYTQRCRLFIGNLPNDITEAEFKKLFSKYGEPSEIFINSSKGFGFIRLESRALAEIAKAELDDVPMKGRQLRVRFATHSAALSVRNLSPFVSNELLDEAFSQFGLVERAVVIVDDRGRSTGKGIVEFAHKPSARKAIDRCNDGVFLLTTTPRPIVVEPLEQYDDEDGLPEKLAQKNPKYQKEREQPPRFAHRGSFEFEYSQRWKSLDEMEKQQRQQVEKNIREAREKLESEMEDAFHEHQANMMRQDLLRRQEELRRMEEMHSQEMAKRKEMQLRQEEERRRREEEMLRQREMEEQMRRQREENYRMGGGGGGGGGGGFMDNREREMRLKTGAGILADSPFGTPNPKFMGGGTPSGGLMGEMGPLSMQGG